MLWMHDQTMLGVVGSTVSGLGFRVSSYATARLLFWFELVLEFSRLTMNGFKAASASSGSRLTSWDADGCGRRTCRSRTLRRTSAQQSRYRGASWWAEAGSSAWYFRPYGTPMYDSTVRRNLARSMDITSGAFRISADAAARARASRRASMRFFW